MIRCYKDVDWNRFRRIKKLKISLGNIILKMIFILYVYIPEHIYVCKSPRKSQEELDPLGLFCELPCICVLGSKSRPQ